MTTHDSFLLDGSLFGRDQMYFIEKDRFGASQLLKQTLNLPTIHGLCKGSLHLQFSAIAFESPAYLHIKQNKQRLICPVF